MLFALDVDARASEILTCESPAHPAHQSVSNRRAAAPFDDRDFVWELKHDGFRAVAYIEAGACRLISRKQIQYKSSALTAAMAGLKLKDAFSMAKSSSWHQTGEACSWT